MLRPGSALRRQRFPRGPACEQGGKCMYPYSGWLALFLGIALAGGAPAADTEDAGFVPLFNGKDLTGWRYGKQALAGLTRTPDGRFEVQNGILIVHEKDAQGRGGIRDLYTVQNFPEEFHLKLQFRAAPRADSGVYIRGLQLQVRDYPTVGPYPKVKFHPGDWNDLDILVRNGVVRTTVNGKVLGPKDHLELIVRQGQPQARLNGQELPVHDIRCTRGAYARCLCNGEVIEPALAVPANGGIGLQAETGKFEYRNIRIKILK
jgi:hypothetical protein